MNIFIIIKILQTPSPDTGFTQRPHSSHAVCQHLQRAYSALEDHKASHSVTTAAVQTRSRVIVFVHVALGDCRVRTVLCWRLHSVHIGDLHF